MLLALYAVAPAPAATVLAKQPIPPVPQTNFGRVANIAFTPQLFVWQAADPGLSNSFASSGRDYLVAKNTHATLTRWVKLISYPETQLNRLGDMLQVLNPGEEYVFGPIPAIGFAQKDNSIYVWSQTADVQLIPFTFA